MKEIIQTLMRKIFKSRACANRRERVEMLIQQSREIEKEDCEKSAVDARFKQWKQAAEDLLSHDKPLLTRFKRLHFKPEAFYLPAEDEVVPKDEWNAEAWNYARTILSDFASADVEADNKTSTNKIIRKDYQQ